MSASARSQEYERCRTSGDELLAEERGSLTPRHAASAAPTSGTGAVDAAPPVAAAGPGGLRSVLLGNPVLCAMLLFVPAGFATYLLDQPNWAVFAANFVALLPMAWLIGKATEDLAIRAGSTAGGLLNATLGNVVEMMLCVAALRRNELQVVQCTLIGSILSNMLLVMGTALLWGGYNNPPPKKMSFSTVAAGAQTTLMHLAVLALVLPTVYSFLTPSRPEGTVLGISRGCSGLLLVVYLQYLYFQLRTHRAVLDAEAGDGGDEQPDMSVPVASLVLVACTALTYFCSEFLIASLDGTISSLNVSKEFIGIILLPIVGNAAEHYTAIVVAGQNKMDLSLAVAIGSSCQMALMVTPFTVLMGWVLDKPMTLNFHPFQVTVLLLTVHLVANILRDGESNWLEGSMMVTAYSAIALIYYCENGELPVKIDALI